MGDRRDGDDRSRIEALRVANEARRHDLDDLPTNQSFAARLFRILDLLADRDSVPQLGQTLDVCVCGMHWDPAHRYRVGLSFIATRQRDVEDRRDEFGVLEKHLVEITHAVEDHRVGML